MTKERQGEAFIIAGGILWSFFPILTVISLSKLPPLVSLAWSNLLAAVFFGIVMINRKKWREIINLAAMKDMLWTTFFMLLLYIFLFSGLKLTTPGNSSLIGLTEVLFTFLLFNVWHKNYISKNHILGALLSVLGAAIVLLPNTKSLNPGDLLVLSANIFAPLGNYFQQKARQKISSETMMLVRSTLAFPILFLLAYLFGNQISFRDLNEIWVAVAINGLILFGLQKMLWIEGIHRISVTKATAMGGFIPLLTLLFSWMILGHIPTLFQLLSFVPLFFGMILLTSKNKESISMPTAAA